MPDALVIASLRSHILLEDDQGQRYHAEHSKTIPCVCGDRVSFQETGSSVQISDCLPRKNLLGRKRHKRPDQNVAANISTLIIVIDIHRINTELIDNYLVACNVWGTKALLLFNKMDTFDPADKKSAGIQATIAAYRSLERYRVLETSMLTGDNLDAVRQALTGETAIMVGLSGAGKTSLANRLIPDLDAKVADISAGSHEGKHTTTEIMLHHINELDAKLVDSPGVRSYHCPDIKQETVASSYFEFYPYLDQCRYPNCKHLKEPDCAVKQALENGEIAQFRYDNYCRLLAEAKKLENPYS